MMSVAVTQRRREIGIRAALGASRREIVTSIFSRSAGQLGIGLLIGIAGSALLDRLAGQELLRGQVVPILAFVAITMLLAGLLATLGPTRRALRIQPMEALRGE
jgi:ABC-type antimicrobial peptide transport system permease subunit